MTKAQQLTFLRLPVKLRGTYVTWLMGYNPYFLMSRETYPLCQPSCPVGGFV
jgi:dolichyl-phosphate-mannose--protein O-mannosyl transferase